MARKRKKGERKPCGRLRQAKTRNDHGPAELRQHNVIRIDDQKRAQNWSECLLDALLNQGKLGPPGEADVRHAAGIWLRGLWEAALGQAVTAAYERKIPGQISDRKDLALTQLMLIAHTLDTWPILRLVCIENIMHPKVNEALDSLLTFKRNLASVRKARSTRVTVAS